MTFLEKLKQFESGLSVTTYRFDKISNFITFEEYVDKKVKEYAKSLSEQPTLHDIYERDNKDVSWDEVLKLSKENCHDSIKIKTDDNRHWGVPAYSIDRWMNDNNFTKNNVMSMKLSQRGWL